MDNREAAYEDMWNDVRDKADATVQQEMDAAFAADRDAARVKYVDPATQKQLGEHLTQLLARTVNADQQNVVFADWMNDHPDSQALLELVRQQLHVDGQFYSLVYVTSDRQIDADGRFPVDFPLRGCIEAGSCVRARLAFSHTAIGTPEDWEGETLSAGCELCLPSLQGRLFKSAASSVITGKRLRILVTGSRFYAAQMVQQPALYEMFRTEGLNVEFVLDGRAVSTTNLFAMVNANAHESAPALGPAHDGETTPEGQHAEREAVAELAGVAELGSPISDSVGALTQEGAQSLLRIHGALEERFANWDEAPHLVADPRLHILFMDHLLLMATEVAGDLLFMDHLRTESARGGFGLPEDQPAHVARELVASLVLGAFFAHLSEGSEVAYVGLPGAIAASTYKEQFAAILAATTGQESLDKLAPTWRLLAGPDNVHFEYGTGALDDNAQGPEVDLEQVDVTKGGILGYLNRLYETDYLAFNQLYGETGWIRRHLRASVPSTSVPSTS